MASRRVSLLVLLAGIVLATAASAHIGIDAVCENGDITLSIHVQDVSSGDDAVGLRLVRRTVGVCDSDLVLNPDTPLPWPEDGQALDHTFTDTAVEPHRGYEYRLLVIQHDGQEVPIHYPLGWPLVTGCDGWGATRGVLPWSGDGYVWEFQPCDCWYPAMVLDLTALDPALYQSLAGRMVEIQGEVVFDEMPGSPDIRVTALVPVDACDSPVPATPTSWSRLKSLYH